MLAAPVYAFDLSLSSEVDTSGGRTQPDFQAQAGQTFGDCRVFLNAEVTTNDPFFPNSPRNYRGGFQYKVVPSVTTETGVGIFSGNVYGYVKTSWAYDSGAK